MPMPMRRPEAMVASAVALGLAGGVPSTDEGPAMTPVGAAVALAGAAPQPGRHVA